MQPSFQSDEQTVAQARRAVAAERKLRWVMLLYAVLFLGICGWFTVVGIRKIGNLEPEQLRVGFVYGLALALCWTSFGVMGGMCLGKFVAGLRRDFRMQQLLICYHDRLGDLGQLSNGRDSSGAGAGDSPRCPNLREEQIQD